MDTEIKGEMQSISAQWKQFRLDHALTQKFLSEIVGVSRRTIQSIESGGIIPQEGTIAKFEELRKKYEKNGKISRKSLRKPKDEEDEYEF
jgi:DNA-binding XRE family transcriptional regulator